MPDPLFLGLDLGTSGARAVVMDAAGAERASAKSPMADHGADHRSPAVWWAAADAALRGALAQVDGGAVVAVAVDGTSGSMVGLDALAEPIGAGVMYNDACTDAAMLARIAQLAPARSAAHGATSGAARALGLAGRGAVRVLHQADWIAYRLSGEMASDANNALKTGYDPESAHWPAWLGDFGIPQGLLPPVVEPATPIGTITPDMARHFGLSPAVKVMAGTTDGCASFLATGASRAGDGVSALGTTLTVKLLSDRPIFAPEFGIYSHRILGMWLAGGASNTGGAALLRHFTPDQMATLSAQIDPATPTGLDYYPLPAKGERFPINDPNMEPRLTPRPADDATFLHALFEGIAGVEHLAYSRLSDLGAPSLHRLWSVGGGAANPVWSAIRQRRLGVPMQVAQSDEAAYGAAILARHGWQNGGQMGGKHDHAG